MDDFVPKLLGEVQRLQDELKGVNPEKPYDVDSVNCGQIIGLLTAVVVFLQMDNKNQKEHDMIEKMLNNMKSNTVN